MARPLGVTVICVLGWLGAILSILGGVALLGVGYVGLALVGGAAGGTLAGLGLGSGVLMLALGVINVVVLWWLWQMKKKGWTWTMVIEAINIVLALVQMSVWSLVIPAIIVAYLWMKKDVFK